MLFFYILQNINIFSVQRFIHASHSAEFPAHGAGVFVFGCTVIADLFRCGVFLFIYGGMIWGAYEKLLQEGEYTEREKRLNKRTAPFAGIYWCIVTVIYLWFSFTTNDWHKTWIIWPVAEVLFAALNGIMKIMMGRDLKYQEMEAMDTEYLLEQSK